MAILVTGGAGYIGSHICVELMNSGYQVVVVDNLENSSRIALQRVQEITGKSLTFYQGDVLNQKDLSAVFEKEPIEAVIHLAGLKAVGESVEKPLDYYHDNITGTLVLCDVMRSFGCQDLIFSSSATVYGVPEFLPITEECPAGKATNPYGRTKAMIEQILSDLCDSDPKWHITLLRYFNPIGAHPSGKIGEDPKGIPNNLVPYLSQVAIGKRDRLKIYGHDYDTPDGTGVRDYLHVVDLAKGHVMALKHLKDRKGISIYNLGTGIGASVLDVVKAYEKACQRPIPYEFQPRRPGDVAICYCDASKAERELGWMAEKDLDQMCRDAWKWQSENPNGYEPE